MERNLQKIRTIINSFNVGSRGELPFLPHGSFPDIQDDIMNQKDVDLINFVAELVNLSETALRYCVGDITRKVGNTIIVDPQHRNFHTACNNLAVVAGYTSQIIESIAEQKPTRKASFYNALVSQYNRFTQMSDPNFVLQSMSGKFKTPQAFKDIFSQSRFPSLYETFSAIKQEKEIQNEEIKKLNQKIAVRQYEPIPKISKERDETAKKLKEDKEKKKSTDKKPEKASTPAPKKEDVFEQPKPTSSPKKEDVKPAPEPEKETKLKADFTDEKLLTSAPISRWSDKEMNTTLSSRPIKKASKDLSPDEVDSVGCCGWRKKQSHKKQHRESSSAELSDLY